MKLRKPLALFLVLALSLGVAPITGASGTSEGQTTLSGGTLTQSNTSKATSGEIVKVIDDKINVTIKNKYDIQVNPYGMIIKYPDDSGTSEESIVSVPLYIENHTDVPVDVTAKATAVPYGDVALDSNPTRYAFKPGAFTSEDEIPSEERVYLYLQMIKLDSFDHVGNDKWDSVNEKAVITKPDGSDPLKVEMPVNGGAALKIGGNTSLPTYYGAWSHGNGFDVNIVLSFLPKQKEGYSVTFEIEDIYGPGLKNPVKIELQGVKDSKTAVLEFNKDKPDPQTVVADESLTFNIKVSESYSEGYLINCVYLIHLDKDGNEIAGSEELMYEDNYTGIIEWSKTINASRVNLNETLKVKVFVEDS